MKKLNLIFTLLVFSIFVFLQNPLYETNANKMDPVVDIDTLPKNYFIMVDRLKPGDSITSQIKVINKGTLNFNYNFLSEYRKGSKEYYDSLYLEINDRNNNNLYSGKLSEFKGLKNSRNLLIFTSEILSVKVLVPHELGNEFQGSAAEAEIIFYAEGITNTPPSCEEDPSQVGCEQPPSCEEDPSQPGCEQPPSCEEDPNQPGCEQPPSCEEDPSRAGCEQPPSCEEDPSQPGCEQPPSCEEDPSQPGCEQPPSCEENPSQPGCEQPPSCEEDSTQPGCEQPPNCEQNPDQDGCEPPGENPEDPEDTEKPGSGENPTKPDTGNPDVKDVVVIPKDVNRLPNTATNNYNLLLVGGVLLGGGSVLLLLNRRSRRRNN
ncbi:LPXTG cell wall anchor domain-containing protein [Bacillus sp. ISL-39]|uniref:LPXTG cell wall anchor domain-containing protein n=1 Tax=Bacillus sp. ISL-39 TaxID=2819124 RepID=UPI001BE57C63|nr:LPXTG cell wall anchor domain-containing protein [Bacillus sp. ISL-39]MBT2637780.1 LPXTG cell wall anchor domain-containing protein [Bacillus sp. ISL-39]